ncbi:FAD-dependent oxidoreductase [Paucibacter sp. R3-3]|uniref:FAD-dependent oxidoreductase n=1 Tax=Roseateles agri TaxID=3098619 RepID=A0ABU5DP10_9BURK|nr:FAD-dependent oxidoreductase [Paucibacter sp. R3-3]MDY0748041.1 FAD-dependent oxidoreductase [Paucibacter sp. R3-3]
MEFPKLFSPIQLAGITVPNRVVMAAMSSALGGEDGSITPELAAFLETRAAGGVGLITVEFTCVDSRFGRAEVRQLTLESERHLDGHRRLVERLRSHGCVPCLQLHMSGRFAERLTLDERLPAAPSEHREARTGKLVARALTTREIYDIVAHYARAARLAVKAGYEVLEIHGAHGYLPMAFLSPRSNTRDDEWGGDFERRLAFPKAILSAVKRELGADRALVYRLSSSEFVPQGLTIEHCESIVPALVQAGADALHVTSGTMHGSFEKMVDSMDEPEGWRLPHAARLRAAANVPVIAIGPTRWPAVAEQAIAEGIVDMIALGRPLLTDPEWARKAAQGRANTIRPCTNCNWCMERVRAHEPIGCAENPRTGRELQTVPLFKPRKGSQASRVLVIGGGPAGMSAALRLDRAGYEVTLYERREALGGGLIASAAPPGKDRLLWYRDYLVAAIARSGINVRLGTVPDVDELRRLTPQAALVATGASDRAMPVEGIHKDIVRSAHALLMGDVPMAFDKQRTAIVYGGGETGCETAEMLVAEGFRVTLVTRSAATDLARGAELMYRRALRARLVANPYVTILEHTHLTSIADDGVMLADAAGEMRFMPAGLVAMAQGRQPLHDMAALLRVAGIPYVFVGDAVRIGRIGDAVRQAFDAASALLGSPSQASST